MIRKSFSPYSRGFFYAKNKLKITQIILYLGVNHAYNKTHREAQRSPQRRVKIMNTFKAVSIVLGNNEMDTHFCSSLTATIEGASGRFFLSADKAGIKSAIDFAKTLDSEITVTEYDCEIEDGNFFFDNGVAVNV